MNHPRGVKPIRTTINPPSLDSCQSIIYSENDVLPEGDAVFTYVMTFKHIKASEAAAILTKRRDLLGADPYGSIAALDSAVVITEKPPVIRKLIQLKQEIDRVRHPRKNGALLPYNSVTGSIPAECREEYAESYYLNAVSSVLFVRRDRIISHGTAAIKIKSPLENGVLSKAQV